MTRNLIWVLAISLISALAGALLYRATIYQPAFASANPSAVASISQPLLFDDIVLNDLNGKPQQLKQWNKPILMVNFWAPWCPPCRREIPALVDLQQQYQTDMQIVGLSFDSQKNVNDFSNKSPMNYPLLLVQSEATAIYQYFGNTSGALPYTAILNQQREIVFRHRGEISREQLEREIKSLL